MSLLCSEHDSYIYTYILRSTFYLPVPYTSVSVRLAALPFFLLGFPLGAAFVELAGHKGKHGDPGREPTSRNPGVF